MPDITEDSPDEPTVRPFAAFIQEQSSGQLHDELSTKLHDLIAAVQKTGKSGQIVLKVDVKPIAGTNGKTLTVTDSVAAKIPQGDRPKSIFFVDGDGNLSRNDPQQPVLTGLREVESTTPSTLRSAQ